MANKKTKQKQKKKPIAWPKEKSGAKIKNIREKYESARDRRIQN